LQEIATIAYNMKRCLRFFLPFIFWILSNLIKTYL
jgi:hypothetical protein